MSQKVWCANCVMQATLASSSVCKRLRPIGRCWTWHKQLYDIQEKNPSGDIFCVYEKENK